MSDNMKRNMTESNRLERNRNEDNNEILDRIKELPEKQRNAIIWMIENFSSGIKMCENLDLTEDELKKYKEEAMAKEDYLMYVLLCAAETFHRR